MNVDYFTPAGDVAWISDMLVSIVAVGVVLTLAFWALGYVVWLVISVAKGG